MNLGRGLAALALLTVAACGGGDEGGEAEGYDTPAQVIQDLNAGGLKCKPGKKVTTAYSAAAQYCYVNGVDVKVDVYQGDQLEDTLDYLDAHGGNVTFVHGDDWSIGTPNAAFAHKAEALLSE